VRIRVVLQQVVAHAVGDDRRHLRPAGSVEVRHGMSAMLAAERRKLIADRVDWRDV
jgi:hypothetical protein